MSYKKLSVAIEALTLIAMNSGLNPVSSKQVCKELGLKLRYTESLMQGFVKAGILKSIRGVAGGYSLGRERRKITANDIYQVVQNLGVKNNAQKSLLSTISDEVINEVEKNLAESLSQITLEEIYDKAMKLRLASGGSKKSDFVI